MVDDIASPNQPLFRSSAQLYHIYVCVCVCVCVRVCINICASVRFGMLRSEKMGDNEFRCRVVFLGEFVSPMNMIFADSAQRDYFCEVLQTLNHNIVVRSGISHVLPCV
jgi:hypothetical protein